MTIVKGELASLSSDEMLVDDKVATDKGWKVGERIPVLFGKTGKTDIALGGTYEQTQNAGTYLITLHTYHAN